MTFTIFGTAGGVELTLGSMTAAGALRRINAMRQCGATLAAIRDEIRSYTEEEIMKMAEGEAVSLKAPASHR